MSATFLSLAQDVARLAEYSVPTTLTGSTVIKNTRYLIEAVKQAYHSTWFDLYIKSEDIQESGTLTLSAGSESYAIPETIDQVLRIYKIGIPRMNSVDWDSFLIERSRPYQGLTNGTPTMYAIWNRRIYFYPVPDTSNTLTIEGTTKFVQLADDTDTTAFDSRYDDVVKNQAMTYLLNMEGKLDMAGGFAAIAQKQLDSFKRADNIHRRPAQRVMSEAELYSRNQWNTRDGR